MVSGGLRVTADPRGLFVLEGGPNIGTFKVANVGDREVKVAPELSVPKGFRGEPMQPQVVVPANGHAQVEVKIWREQPDMPRGTLTLHAENAFDWKSVIATDDWVRIATMSASSNPEGNYWLGWDPVQAQNGFTVDDWASGRAWGWRDATAGVFPDWLQATWETPRNLAMVRVVTLGTESDPASEYGLRDYDVQVRSGNSWRRVAQVRGNTEGVIESSISPVTTRALRILIHDSNDGRHSRVLALEAYSPGGKPTPELDKRFGGPGAFYPRT